MRSKGKTSLPAAALMSLAACVYNRPQAVTEQMARTEAVVEQAESSGAREQALAELQQAKDKYAEAQRAYRKETEDGDKQAMRLAQQAAVDAKYATAVAQNERQQAAAREIQDGLRTLREEARRDASSPSTQL